MKPNMSEPSSVEENRRPIADVFRTTAKLAVRICVKLNIHPNVISWSSIVPAAIAAVCFWQSRFHPWLLVPAACGCGVRLWFNMLDGMVAIAANKTSKTGEVANELPDRLSDLLIFVGIAHAATLDPPFTMLAGYWAAFAALLTAYIGTLGQAVGAKRQFGGVMSKPWRMVIAMVAAAMTLLLPNLNELAQQQTSHSLMGIGCWVVVAGCAQTVWVRYRRIIRELKE